MAVLKAWPGLSVRVKVADQPATEYEPGPGDDARQASPDCSGGDPKDSAEPLASTCYIEATTGLPFCLEAEIASEFEIPAPYEFVVLRVTVDGVHAGGWLRSVVKKSERPVTLTVDYIEELMDDPGKVKRRFFAFAPVSAIEDAEKPRVICDTKKVNSLGTIQATVSIGFGRMPYNSKETAISLSNTDHLQIAEKAMKGRELTHGTSFSAGSVGPKSNIIAFKSERVIGRFSFLYRSRSALQRAMVLPPSRPSSPPTDECDKLESMGKEELRKLARDLLRSRKPSTLTGASSSIKRDPDEEDKTAHARKSKRAKSGGREKTVDLTSD